MPLFLGFYTLQDCFLLEQNVEQSKRWKLGFDYRGKQQTIKKVLWHSIFQKWPHLDNTSSPICSSGTLPLPSSSTWVGLWVLQPIKTAEMVLSDFLLKGCSFCLVLFCWGWEGNVHSGKSCHHDVRKSRLANEEKPQEETHKERGWSPNPLADSQHQPPSLQMLPASNLQATNSDT